MNTPVTSVRVRPLPDPALAREWLGAMQLVRRFANAPESSTRCRQIGGFLHLAIGEEALVVGATRALEDRDWLLSTWRSHALAVARGTDVGRAMAELFGRVGGTNGGRGGAMHLVDPERRFLGGFGLVGAHLPVAAGVALASSYQGRAEVTMALLGDGAGSNGTLAESLDLAAIWHLPLVLVVAHERRGHATPQEADAAIATLARKAEGHGVKSMLCNGMDVVDSQAVCAEAVQIARTERRPVLVQATVHRAPTPTMADPRPAGDKETLAAWKERDPRRHVRRAARGGRPAGELGPRTDADDREQRRRTGRELGRPIRAPRGGVALRRVVRRAGPRLARGGCSRRRHPRRARPAVPRGRPVSSTSLSYREALRAALREELDRDERVFLIGEDIGAFDGPFHVTKGLLADYGERRVRDTPSAERAIVGIGAGSAMVGLRPVVELMTITAATRALDELLVIVAQTPWATSGAIRMPLVVRTVQGGGHQLGPTHAHHLEALLMHLPGLQVVAPSTTRRCQGPAEGGDPERGSGGRDRAPGALCDDG